MNNKAAFFDRDGTLIEDVSYLSRLDQILFLPASIELCHMLQKQGFLLFVVTNQSGVARGMFDEEFVKQTHKHLDIMLQKVGVTITGWYYCPHHPTSGIIKEYVRECSCRKPQPGMLLSAASQFKIDLSKSLMFGDKKSDIEAGNAAGCKSFYITEINCDSMVQSTTSIF